MHDPVRAESGARADWQACTTHAFLLDHRTSCSFSGVGRFCCDNHGSFVYDSPNLFCGPSGLARTGLTGVRSEPGHRTHLTSLLFVTSLLYCNRPLYLFLSNLVIGSKTSRDLSPFLTSCKPFFAHARSQRMGFDDYGIRDRFLWAKMSNEKKSIMVCPPPQVQKESDLEKEARFLANPFSSFPIFLFIKTE